MFGYQVSSSFRTYIGCGGTGQSRTAQTIPWNVSVRTFMWLLQSRTAQTTEHVWYDLLLVWLSQENEEDFGLQSRQGNQGIRSASAITKNLRMPTVSGVWCSSKKWRAANPNGSFHVVQTHTSSSWFDSPQSEYNLVYNYSSNKHHADDVAATLLRLCRGPRGRCLWGRQLGRFLRLSGRRICQMRRVDTKLSQNHAHFFYPTVQNRVFGGVGIGSGNIFGSDSGNIFGNDSSGGGGGTFGGGGGRPCPDLRGCYLKDYKNNGYLMSTTTVEPGQYTVVCEPEYSGLDRVSFTSGGESHDEYSAPYAFHIYLHSCEQQIHFVVTGHAQYQTQCFQRSYTLHGTKCACPYGQVRNPSTGQCEVPCTHPFRCPANSQRIPGQTCYDSMDGK